MKVWQAVFGVVVSWSTAWGALAPGDEVSLEAVRKAKWVQGHAPESFEPGKVYIFECWATWCGPCVAAIPHMNELHKKYYDKGLRVHGMNVWEDDQGAVKAFVKNKGKGMSYPVAFTGGRGGAFDKTWLEPAGVRGIPFAFVVANGKFVQGIHPGGLSDDLIEKLLADAEKSTPKAAPEKRSIDVVLKDYQKALDARDADAMAAMIDEAGTLEPKCKDLPDMRMDLLVAKQDWSSAAKAIEVMSDHPGGIVFLQKLTQKVVMDETRSYPPEWLKMLATAHANSRKVQGTTAMDHVGLAMLYWRAGEKETAREHAKQAVTVAGRESEKTPNPAMVEYVSKFSAAVEAGNMPSMKEFHASMPRKAD